MIQIDKQRLDDIDSRLSGVWHEPLFIYPDDTDEDHSKYGLFSSADHDEPDTVAQVWNTEYDGLAWAVFLAHAADDILYLLQVIHALQAENIDAKITNQTQFQIDRLKLFTHRMIKEFGDQNAITSK